MYYIYTAQSPFLLLRTYQMSCIYQYTYFFYKHLALGLKILKQLSQPSCNMQHCKYTDIEKLILQKIS